MKQVFLIISASVFAFLVLFISILRTASVRYSFLGVYADYADRSDLGKNNDLDKIKIDYFLAYPGEVLPDHPLWYLKALRDKIWLAITTNKDKKAELNLLFADKRLGSALILFERGKVDIGFSTLTKAEKYLDEAAKIESEIRAGGGNTVEITGRLTKASLKHRLVIKKIILSSPEEVIPSLQAQEDISKSVYERESIVLQSFGYEPPKNPF